MSAIVDEWIGLKRQDWETYRRLDELKPLINAFCEEHGYRRLFGSDGAAIDRRPQHVTAPDADRDPGASSSRSGCGSAVLAVDPKKLSDLIECRARSPPTSRTRCWRPARTSGPSTRST